MNIATKRVRCLRNAHLGSCGLLTLLLVLAFQSAGADDAHVTLSPTDRVQITVFGHEDLSGEMEIDPMGRITMPLVGDIEAGGLTLDELEQAIVDALQPDYLLNPRVTAQLLSVRPFYILGEVNTPGSYPYTDGMTVVRAVAVAGGFTHRARSKRIVIHRIIDGEEIEMPADADTEVQPGDVIDVPERFF